MTELSLWLNFTDGTCGGDATHVFESDNMPTDDQRCVCGAMTFGEYVESITPKPRGFWTQTPEGNVAHITGDPNMSEETLNALRRMADMAYKQMGGDTE